MKLIVNPKHLFRSKKNQSVSRSEPSSSGSVTSSDSLESSSSSSSSIHKADAGKKIDDGGTPTSVLPSHSHDISDISGEWSEISGDLYFELEQAFKLIDKDGDGKITRKELEALLSRVGTKPPSDEELTMMLSEVDSDGDGCISLEEFGAIRSAFEPPACDAELRDAFDFFDTDRDGRITAEELHRVFSAIGDDRSTLEECRLMISTVDKNGDGFVCFEDFTLMMEQQRA
ncbi:probable calcium-binding protein CML35 [Cornus florida]|uniref:probable calcium-binding protein CML35 n=1 Tax=Cornus florida TaxID=4283 RepID=UPI0028975654|nr:probable calcium-binding protein CML35 [Cornus florida]